MRNEYEGQAIQSCPLIGFCTMSLDGMPISDVLHVVSDRMLVKYYERWLKSMLVHAACRSLKHFLHMFHTLAELNDLAESKGNMYDHTYQSHELSQSKTKQAHSTLVLL